MTQNQFLRLQALDSTATMFYLILFLMHIYIFKKEILYHLISVKTEPLTIITYNEYIIIKTFSILTCQTPSASLRLFWGESLASCSGVLPVKNRNLCSIADFLGSPLIPYFGLVPSLHVPIGAFTMLFCHQKSCLVHEKAMAEPVGCGVGRAGLCCAYWLGHLA